MSTRCMLCDRKFVEEPKYANTECRRHSALHACEALDLRECFANSVHIGDICNDCYSQAKKRSAKRKQMRGGVRP
jgi:hypothetical protein